ncbi:carbon storage regulator [Bremerella cremea]|uniref:Translational regulator CsrA n=1 Tax=Bremerella cremea TaxID=1031537 RepID=A0A368KNN8_9BACT|nr:carbon storage regulator [Bremerella cremea]RCS46064.1 carbon storage regulator [Bremerella cremea]
MLVLSRKEGEKLRLGDEILITVVKVGADKVRLGIQAPSNLLILRDELDTHDQIEAEDEERTTLVFTAEVDQLAAKTLRIAA